MAKILVTGDLGFMGSNLVRPICARIKSSREIRVSLVCRFPFGIQRWYTYLLAQALSRKGIFVKLYGPKSNLEECPYEKVWNWWSYPFDIVSKALKDRLNIVHIQFEFPTFRFFGALLLPLCLLLLKFARVKCVVTIHGPILPLDKKAERIIREIMPDNYKQFPTKLVLRGLRLLYMLMEKIGARIIVHSHVFRKWLLGYGLRRVNVIYHGVNPPESSKRFLNEDASSIVCFGTISPRRGIEDFIMAIYMIRDYLISKNFNVIIAGRLAEYYTEYAALLSNLIDEIGLNGLVSMKYNVSDEEMDRLFEDAYIAVLPYKVSVSASGALSTAFEHGVPVLVADTDYFREVLGPDFIGLFETGNSERLAEKLFMVLSNGETRKRILEQMISKLSPYKWDIIASETIKIYTDILRNHSIANFMKNLTNFLLRKRRRTNA